MKYSRVYLDAIGYELPPVIVSSQELEARLHPVYEALRITPGANRILDRHCGTTLVGARILPLRRRGGSRTQGTATVQRAARRHRSADLCRRLPRAV